MKKPAKAKNTIVTQDFLDHRATYSAKLGYSKQKWVEFCETFLKLGFEIRLYEALKTVSKYVTVRDLKTNNQFKVRFSNHRPNKYREETGDCDFFVGRTHLGISTTDQAIVATRQFFKEQAA